MRKRRNTIKLLKNKVPKSLEFRVDLLKEEIKIFFINMSLYLKDNKYVDLYCLLYNNSNELTYLEINIETKINEKTIKKFVKETENFIYEFIKRTPYYSILEEYIE